MRTPNVNLYLVGFMGVGKTTVGRIVAQRLGYRLLDSDHEIERLTGKSIPDIFAQDGESTFRLRERAFIAEGHPTEGCVVACGGGLIVQPGMLELVQQRGVLICLHASLETILQRTSGSRSRPLLNVEDPAERIRTLFAQREPVYRRAGTMILTDGRPLLDVTAHVMRAYRREAFEWEQAHRKPTL
ncbi:MAG TPA: shikimate kinase [Opitutaceae bacterium]|jgi:shikimate kinase|nr:shikimate kinase [Opitutaceae bacterium]OQB97894.1 MAG: Shikimate kinase 1 [Verrucomicrobia bacterium ADurb.Bin122]MBP8961339.1 shikimate kinase [Opitutaceae bacterium]HOD46067.1 shikimate kinase [Opitutaceae bacterium]HOF08535.1 shikimate kinase [Opitutaceae bacterium]